MLSSPTVVNSKQYCDFLSYVHRNSTQIKRFCSESELLIFNDSGKILSKIPPNAKFGPVRPKELCAFFFVFPPSSSATFFFAHRLI